MTDALVLGSDAARAVGRFNPAGPTGYRASSAPDAPLRETRSEAVADEWKWRILPRPGAEYPQRAIVSFNREDGAGHAVFRDADAARELLATDQSQQIHEAAYRYLYHIGAPIETGDLALFDFGDIA